MKNRKLKFEGFTVGQRIRAYDFEPRDGATDRYVIGVILAVMTPDQVAAAGVDGAFAAYKIKVDTDTVFDQPREVLYVPLEVSIFEWDGRVTLVPPQAWRCDDCYAWALAADDGTVCRVCGRGIVGEVS